MGLSSTLIYTSELILCSTIWKKKHKRGKRVCICFLPNGHWSARNGGELSVKNKAGLKIENKVLRNKVNNKAAMKRELFMDNVLNNDESVKFYTGLLTLTCSRWQYLISIETFGWETEVLGQ